MRFIIGILFFMATAIPAAADIYKYVDSNGVTIFTDNLSEVPSDQRATVESFKEIKSAEPSPGQIQPQKESDSQPKQPSPEISKKEGDPNSGTLAEIQALNAEKQQLDKEYEALVREKQALKKNRPDLTTAAELESFRKKVAALNTQIKAFDLKRDAFEAKVRDFNSRNSRKTE